jgi:tetratricopeptide (TPR) repeat protein
MKPERHSILQAMRIGMEHHQAGRLQEAERAYRQVLNADPGNPDAFHLLGIIAHQAGKNEAAVRWIDKALSARPDFAEALSNRGLALQALGRHGEALASYDKALSVRRGFAEAHYNRGNALQELERHDEALASYDKALSIKPDYVEALSNRAPALRELKRHDEALASCDRALAIQPGFAEAWSNRALALEELRRYDEALASYDRALAIQPGFAEAWSNRALPLQQLNRLDEALASCDRALAIQPGFAEAHCNRGNALKALQRYGEALASYDKALAAAPALADARWSKGLCQLLTGDFERGWENYEWRWKSGVFPDAKRNDFSKPPWLGGEDIAGKTVLLHAEQGFGDTIQFARYAKSVAGKGATVILQVQPALKTMLSDIAGAQQVLGQDEPLPEFDFHCPLLSLPLAMGTRPETIPADIPYLRVADAAAAKWKAKLPGHGASRVGIAWSGHPAHRNDHNRSIALSRLLPLQCPGASLVSLQKDVRPDDAKVLAANQQILHFASELGDFSDAAALISLMDLVISVDTSIAHLAGALGKPVWILLPFDPDWRWLVDRKDSPWYPTARLYRQPEAGDWASVVERVGRDLGDRFGTTQLSR